MATQPQYSQQQIDSAINAAANKYGVPAAVLYAVGQTESGLNPNEPSGDPGNGPEGDLYQLDADGGEGEGLGKELADRGGRRNPGPKGPGDRGVKRLGPTGVVVEDDLVCPVANRHGTVGQVGGHIDGLQPHV